MKNEDLPYYENIQYLRKKNRLKQHKLAELIGVSQGAFANYECAKRTPTIENFVKLADYFNVTLDELIRQKLQDVYENQKCNSQSEDKNVYFAQNMKYLRAKKWLSQKEYADVIGVSAGAVAMWETNKRQPDINMLLTISNSFEVSLDDLIKNELCPSLPLYISNIRFLRKKYRMTQENMADFLGYKGKQGYGMIETGYACVSAENLIKLADHFNVTLDQLVKQDLAKVSESKDWKEDEWEAF